MGLSGEDCVRRKACTKAGGQIDFQSRETDGDNERWEENKQRDATCCVQPEVLIGRVVMRRRAEEIRLRRQAQGCNLGLQRLKKCLNLQLNR